MQMDLTMPAADAAGWHLGPMLGLDFETTGTDPKTARPVSVACVLEHGGQVLNQYAALMDCGLDAIPEQAAEVHGITLERIREEGEPAAYALQMVLNAVEDAFFDGIPVVIFNAPYDWPLLREELKRHGMAWPMQPPLFVDPLAIERHLDKSRSPKRLADVCARYGVKLDAAHDALADTLAAVALARAQANRHPALARASLQALQGDQRLWHAQWATGFNAYLRRQGRPLASTEWPG